MQSSEKISKGQLDIDHKLDKDISTLPAVTLPLAGTEELVIVQSGVTKKVAVSEISTDTTTSQKTITGNVTTHNQVNGL